GRINHTQLKKEFQEKYKSRVTKLLNTLLSGGNLIKAINSWAVPVLTYSFGIVKWSVTDLDELDRLTRRLLTKFRHLHTNSSVIRLYLPRRRGGTGLLNIKNQCINQEASLRRKLLTNRDPLITAVAREDAGYTPLSLGCELIPVETNCEEDEVLTYVQRLNALYADFKIRFEDVLNMVIPQWITQPHKKKTDIILQEELIGISTNEELKVQFRNEYQLSGFKNIYLLLILYYGISREKH
ncbi:hypothetical protein NQ318_008279, partial [Aromia moschata]